MASKIGRYSYLIRPILYSIDLVLIVLFIIFLHPGRANSPIFYPFLIVGWFVSAFFTQYYSIFRFTSPIKILEKATKQYLLYALIYFSYFSFGPTTLQIPKAFYYILSLFVLMFLVKFLSYWLLKIFRIKGGNRRNTIVIGSNQASADLINHFFKKPIYGYNYLGFFTDKAVSNKLGAFVDSFEFIKNNHIDDIYCSVREIEEEQLKQLIKFANTHFKTLKFIPDSHQILATGFEVDYYDYFPVLSLQKIALNKPINRFFKRLFDVILALFVVVFILSWLVPLLYVLIKLESKGNLFYVQDRNGLDYKKFKCYKFRTLKQVQHNTQHIAKNDNRVTKIGAFLRKTSIDELPQFINVLKGDMSVVGPRPHMLSYNKTYAEQVDNVQLMARHLVLPGITGLAQIRGYRGEVKTDADISGRVKLDLFYINNWSIFMDIRIILVTIITIFKGDDKAY